MYERKRLPTTDVDLLVRYGSPFPGTEPGGNPTSTFLLEGAHYRSISAESTSITRLISLNSCRP